MRLIRAVAIPEHCSGSDTERCSDCQADSHLRSILSSRPTLRVDARRNYDHILAVARTVVEQDGAEASLRDIARKAEVGLGTLYRHFPTRENLLETLLRDAWAELISKGQSLRKSGDPDAALVSWLGDFAEVTRVYRGLVTALADAYADENSALHASCVSMRACAAALLSRAQTQGTARSDLDGADMFAIVGAAVWMSEQPSLKGRADHMFNFMTSAIFAC